jgi:hypothetical protein
MKPEFYQQSAVVITIRFKDANDEEVVPNHIEYTIINAADSTVIRLVTPIYTNNTYYALELHPEDNIILNPTLELEEHVLTVEWDYRDGMHGTEKIRYNVRNLWPVDNVIGSKSG